MRSALVLALFTFSLYAGQERSCVQLTTHLLEGDLLYLQTKERMAEIDEAYEKGLTLLGTQGSEKQRLASEEYARARNLMISKDRPGYYLIPDISTYAEDTISMYSKERSESIKAFFVKNAQGEVVVQNRKGAPFSTMEGVEISFLPEFDMEMKNSTKRALWVMDWEGNFYLELRSVVGVIHHDSLLAGRPVAGAGEIMIDDSGRILEISGQSGHYLPPRFITRQALDSLKKKGVRMENVKIDFGDAKIKMEEIMELPKRLKDLIDPRIELGTGYYRKLGIDWKIITTEYP